MAVDDPGTVHLAIDQERGGATWLVSSTAGLAARERGFECDQMAIVEAGITGAGADLTKKTFQDAVFRQQSFDAAGLASGKGSLSATKTWLASSVQQVVVSANPDGFKGGPDAGGLSQGKCLSPLSCFRTVPNTVTPLTYTLSP